MNAGTKGHINVEATYNQTWIAEDSLQDLYPLG